MLSNCGVGKNSWESPDSKEIKPVSPKGSQPWLLIGRTEADLACWCKGPTHWKRPWCWERLRARGEGSHRGWDGWMALLTQWTWVWANSRRLWRTGKPGVLQSMGSQRVGHWATEQQGRLPSASAETEPCAAAAVDLQHPLQEIQGGDWGTLLQGNWWNRSLDS